MNGGQEGRNNRCIEFFFELRHAVTGRPAAHGDIAVGSSQSAGASRKSRGSRLKVTGTDQGGGAGGKARGVLGGPFARPGVKADFLLCRRLFSDVVSPYMAGLPIGTAAVPN